MLDLSSLMPSADRGKAEFHDMELHQLRQMNPHQRDAHINSMLHSMRSDFAGRKLRIVVSAEEFELEANPNRLGAEVIEKLPGARVALSRAQEVVVRFADRRDEFVVKAETGTGHEWRPRTDLEGAAPAADPTPAAPATGSLTPKRRMLI